jgi:hypothetical protein
VQIEASARYFERSRTAHVSDSAIPSTLSRVTLKKAECHFSVCSGVPKNFFRGITPGIFSRRLHQEIFRGDYTRIFFSGDYTRNFFGGLHQDFFRGDYTRNFSGGLHQEIFRGITPGILGLLHLLFFSLQLWFIPGSASVWVHLFGVSDWEHCLRLKGVLGRRLCSTYFCVTLETFLIVCWRDCSKASYGCLLQSTEQKHPFSVLVEIKCINVRHNTTVFLNCWRTQLHVSALLWVGHNQVETRISEKTYILQCVFFNNLKIQLCYDGHLYT